MDEKTLLKIEFDKVILMLEDGAGLCRGRKLPVDWRPVKT